MDDVKGIPFTFFQINIHKISRVSGMQRFAKKN